MTPSGKVCDGHGRTWGTTGENGCNWRLSHRAGAVGQRPVQQQQ